MHEVFFCLAILRPFIVIRPQATQERSSFIKSKILLRNICSAFLCLREIAQTYFYCAIVYFWECMAHHAHGSRNPLTLLLIVELVPQYNLDDAVHTRYASISINERKFQQRRVCLTELYMIGTQCSQWFIQCIRACSNQIVRNGIRMQEGKEAQQFHCSSIR